MELERGLLLHLKTYKLQYFKNEINKKGRILIKNKGRLFLIILLFILLISSSNSAAAGQQRFNLYNFLDTGAEYLIEYKLQNMSLEEKVGQLFQVGFHGRTVNKEIKDLIKNNYVGGVIYFARNLESLKQSASLSNELQNLALNSGSTLPLFVAVDQEGGMVNRVKGATHFPGSMSLGAAGDIELSRRAAAATALELKRIGINFNLAPVLDVNNNAENPVIGVRSFGGDPKLVADMGAAYINGLQSQNVAAAAKHFPGHGDTAVDSHFKLPIIDHSRKRLEKIELYPFKKAAAAGVDAIMTSHIYFPAIEAEPGIPATLSKSVLTGLLRRDLNFEGLIISDCLEMEAVASSFGTAEGAVRSIEAGSDIILISHSYHKQKQAFRKVVKAVKSGSISEKRVNESLRRIIKLKIKRINLAALNQPLSAPFNFKKHSKLAQEIAESAVTLIKNDGIFPIDNLEAKKLTVINFELNQQPAAAKNPDSSALFIAQLREELKAVKTITLNKNMAVTNSEKREINNSDLLIVCTDQGFKRRYQIKVAEKLAENNKVFVLALSSPYDYLLIDKSQAFMTIYDYSPANQKAAADFILNKFEAAGKLPVKID